MARETLSHARVACEGPSPTVRGAVFPVARGPSDAIRASERVSPAIVGVRGCWRGTGPRPTMKCRFSRSAGALGCHTRIRAGFPRDRCMARDRPPPYETNTNE